VTLELKHTFTTEPEVETVTFQNIATGGIKGIHSQTTLCANIVGTSGIYRFPCTELNHSDHVFGAVLITAERKPLSKITNPFLKEGWTLDVETTPFANLKGVLWTYTVPDKSQRSDEWCAEQVWGYAEHDVPGYGRQKRYTRRIHFTSPSLTKDVLLVYDQEGAGTSTTSSSNHDDEDLASYGAS
jgi:hypothetical protein